MGKRTNKFLSSNDNRTIIIILEVAVLLTIIVLTCALFKGKLLPGSDKPTLYVTQFQSTEANDETTSVQSGLKGEAQKSTDNLYSNVNTDNSNNFLPGTQSGVNNTGSLSDPSGWSTEQILSLAKDSVNKTKLYKNNLNVHHKESFEATVTECTGGSIVQSIANLMVGWVVKPVDETLSYSGGFAKNSEGETVPIILPKRNGFELTSKGVASASATRLGSQYVVRISLVPESVDINTVPVHNAGAIGYLDVGSFDISFMEVDSADITYRGSSVELHINSEGYVTYAAYKVPLTIEGSAHKGSISGSATFVGEQSEIWTLNY